MQKNFLTRAKTKLRRYCPPILPVCVLLALISAVMQVTTKTRPALADTLNYYYGGVVRMVTGTLSRLLPFSMAEGLLLFSPVLLAVLIGLAVRAAKKGLRASIRYLCVLLSIICILYTLFVASLGLGYNVSSLDEKLSLTDEAVSAEELAETMDWLIKEANALCGEVDFHFGGFSVMPFENYDSMCRDLMTGYARFHQDYPLFLAFSSSVKPVILSEAMSYTHITGIYTFFTGESNLNINFPDYTLPFTAAHELAHQRGFAREKEANMVAFLVCISGESPYTRYSGYVNMIEYFSNALYSADKELWNTTMAKLDNRIRYEMQAYNAFYETYRENTAAKVSSALNDTYLKSQGQSAGTKSYGLVVDLTVAYYQAHIREDVTVTDGEVETP